MFFELNDSEYRSGDVLQYYNQNAASRSLRITETQDPNLFAGYHHEWGPGVHTLLLAGRLQDEFSLTDTNGIGLITTKNPSGQIVGVAQRGADIDYQSDLIAYSIEGQQIFQSARQTLILGARYQTGDIDTDSFIERLRPVNQTVSLSLDRITGYGYYTLQVLEPLQLTAAPKLDEPRFQQTRRTLETQKWAFATVAPRGPIQFWIRRNSPGAALSPRTPFIRTRCSSRASLSDSGSSLRRDTPFSRAST